MEVIKDDWRENAIEGKGMVLQDWGYYEGDWVSGRMGKECNLIKQKDKKIVIIKGIYFRINLVEKERFEFWILICIWRRLRRR